MSDIRDRIAKLLSMANHERSNAHEAETAMRMAERLMRQHNIDVADLESSTGKQTIYAWTSVKIAVGENAGPMSKRPRWIDFLTVGIGAFCDCKAVWSFDKEYGHCIKFMGDRVDIDHCGWLFKRLRDYGYAGSRSVAGRHRGTFRNAYAIRLCDRMKTLRAERDVAMKAAITTSGTALMVVQNKLVLRDAEFGKQGRGRTSRVRFASDGFTQGRAAAERVNFNRPIGGAAQGQLS